jgi:hypothetical protein
MSVARLTITIPVMLALAGCQGMSLPDSGGIVIGVEITPHQEQDYAFAIALIDKATGKPAGQFSRIFFEKGNLLGTNDCKNDVCYFKANADTGDYILYNFIVSNSPRFFGKGGALAGHRVAASRDMSKGTFVFHVNPGRFTYVGTVVVNADVENMLNTDRQAGFEPTFTYRLDLDATKEALKDFKGFPTDLVSSKPAPATFEP